MHAEAGRQSLQLLPCQRLKCDGGPGPTGRQPGQALREPHRVLGALGEHEQHPFPDQAARDEQERPQRVDVRPLRVVDDDGHGCLLLELRERLQDPGADADRLLRGQRAVASRPQPCGADPRDAHELVDDAVRDERLPLFARGAQHGQVGLVVQQAVQDRGPADPGWALEQDDPGPARADGRELAPQRGEFGPPPDEGPALHGVVSHHSWRANR